MLTRLLLFALAVLTGVVLQPPEALAGGGSDFDPAPAPDLTAEPATAVVQPTNPDGKPHQVQAALLLDHSTVAPGQPASLGVHLEHAPQWHTYWKSPGDIGLPTSVKLTLPEGFAADDQIHPIPVRFENEGIVSFGYDARVLHELPLTISGDVAPGSYPIEAEVEWLVCKTSCVPGGASLKTTVQVGEAASASSHVPVFDYWRARHAGLETGPVQIKTALSHDKVTPNNTVQVAFHLSGADGTALHLPDGAWPTFTPIASSLDWMIDSSKVQLTQDGGALVTLSLLAFEPDPLPKADQVGGLVQVKVGETWHRFEIFQPLSWAGADHTPVATNDPLFNTPIQGATTEAPPAPAEPPATTEASGTLVSDAANEAASDPIGLGAALVLAFVGGLILNVMPCVLPVLLLKLYSLVEQAGVSDGQKRTAGMAYTAGILVSFWALALAVFVARTAFGESVGWGFQMQSPTYVAGVTTAVFLFGLSMFGVFEIPAFGTSQAHELSSDEGPAGYFFTGVFATLVATPCSAPFLGTAISFGFQAPTAILFLVFTLIGAGLAAPFLLVAFVPAAYKLLPKPGAWMETFKELLGFALVATAVWLVDVFGGLTGTDGLTGLLIFLLFSGIGAWIFGRYGGVAAEGRTQLMAGLAGVAVMALGGWLYLDLELAEDEVCDDGAIETASLDFSHEIPWQRFSTTRVDELAGKTVFIDFTADWCVSCKVNEKTVLETQTVRSKMSELGVVPLVADWTRRNDEITQWLRKYDRAGVPMYLVVPPTGLDDAILLPEVITTGMVNDALAKASTLN